jgi:hypothetical protein
MQRRNFPATQEEFACDSNRTSSRSGYLAVQARGAGVDTMAKAPTKAKKPAAKPAAKKAPAKKAPAKKAAKKK